MDGQSKNKAKTLVTVLYRVWTQNEAFPVKYKWWLLKTFTCGHAWSYKTLEPVIRLHSLPSYFKKCQMKLPHPLLGVMISLTIEFEYSLELNVSITISILIWWFHFVISCKNRLDCTRFREHVVSICIVL